MENWAPESPRSAHWDEYDEDYIKDYQLLPDGSFSDEVLGSRAEVVGTWSEEDELARQESIRLHESEYKIRKAAAIAVVKQQHELRRSLTREERIHILEQHHEIARTAAAAEPTSEEVANRM